MEYFFFEIWRFEFKSHFLKKPPLKERIIFWRRIFLMRIFFSTRIFFFGENFFLIRIFLRWEFFLTGDFFWEKNLFWKLHPNSCQYPLKNYLNKCIWGNMAAEWKSSFITPQPQSFWILCHKLNIIIRISQTTNFISLLNLKFFTNLWYRVFKKLVRI